MKNKIEEILKNSYTNFGEFDESKATKELLDLFSVSVLLPTDEQIEETADVAYKYVKENFPIDDEYCYTQGYINGMTALRNIIKGNKR
jgi:hypothetical protein